MSKYEVEIISIEERNGKLYAKVKLPDEHKEELNDLLYSKVSISSRGIE